MFRCLTTAAALAAATASFCDPTDGWQIAWQDEFSGPGLDLSSWNVHIGDDDSLCRDSCCTSDNVVVTNGTLVLMSKSERPAGCQYTYTSAAVTTQTKRNWAPSPRFRVCVSAILPGGVGTGAGKGVWPAHWMMPDDSSCWPDHGEIDILEMINGDGFAHGTYHWSAVWPAKNCTYNDTSQTSELRMPADWGTAFHEYAVEHGGSYVAFVYDGQVVANMSGTPVQALDSSAPLAGLTTAKGSGDDGAAAAPVPIFGPWPWYLMLNTAIGGPWPGPTNSSTVFPTNHTIDYVRVTVPL